MPVYRVQLKQGRRTITNQIEAKSVASCVAFFETLTTMKVTEVLKLEYFNDTLPPIDDFNYFSVLKGILKNGVGMSRQIVLNNIKLNKNENDIALACKMNLEVASASVDSLVSTLFKK